jgi:hypothetical protein
MGQYVVMFLGDGGKLRAVESYAAENEAGALQRALAVAQDDGEILSVQVWLGKRRLLSVGTRPEYAGSVEARV